MPTVEEHRRRLERVKSKKPQEVNTEVCLDPALHEDLEAAMQSQDQERIEAARAAIAEASEPLTLRSIGRMRYDKLIGEHPPTGEQNDQHTKDHGVEAPYNVETFSVALVAACLVAAVLDPIRCADSEWDELYDETVEQVQMWADTWNSMEFASLWTAALSANTASHIKLVGKAYG